MKNILFCCLYLLCLVNVYGRENNFLQNISLTYENDSVYGKDRYYTNGIQLSFLSNNFDLLDNDVKFYNYSFGLGQKIFTASDIEIEFPEKNDHPYAGYLYFYLNKNFFYKNNIVNLFGFSIGTTGKNSLAEDTQKKIHDLIGSPEPMGWKTQIDNELLFMFTYSHIRELYNIKFSKNNFNILSKSTINLGTPYINMKQYFEFRYGLDVFGDFSSYRISNDTIGIISNTGDFNYYVFSGVGLNGVFYDTFLDGNIGDRRKEVNKKPIVYEISAGAVVEFGKFYVKYTTAFVSEEFEEQDGGQVLFVLSGGIKF